MYVLRKLGSVSTIRTHVNVLFDSITVCPITIKKRTFQRTFHSSLLLKEKSTPRALRNIKPKSKRNTVQYFVDIKQIRTVGGKGGDGAIMFLHVYLIEFAGPSGGDAGNGGHVIFEAPDDKINNVLTSSQGHQFI